MSQSSPAMPPILRAGKSARSERFRLGIKGRLFGAFAAVASLTLIASIVAFLSYAHIGRSFRRIELEANPAMSHSLNLAREAAELSATSSTLLAAADQAALATSLERIQTERREFSAALDAFDTRSIGWVAFARLLDSVETLEANVTSLASSIEWRLAATADRTRLGAAARAAHAVLVEKLAPLLDDAEFSLMSGLETAGELHDQIAVGRSLAKLSTDQASALIALTDLRAESNAILGILTEVSLTVDADLLPPLRDRFTAGSYSARKAAGALGDADQMRELRTTLEALLAIGKTGSGIFEARQDELAAIAKGWQLAAANQADAQTLAQEVQQSVKRGEEMSAGALSASRAAIQQSQAVLIFLVLISLGIAVAITWFYVGKGLLRRLGRLNQAILSLASGNLDVSVPHEGRDELTRIASAVEVFKSSAIRARELEADKEKGRIEDLKQREASFRLLFESNPVQMWLFDQQSLSFLAVNDAAVKHYGYSREQFLAMTILDIRPAEERDEIARIVSQKSDAFGSGRTCRHLKADGTVIEVAVYARRLTYEGRPATLTAAIDITDRNRAEEELNRTREFLNTIIDNVPVALIVKDAKDLRCVLSNRAAGELWGFSCE
jgi:PAS domain S-box-containing protein